MNFFTLPDTISNQLLNLTSKISNKNLLRAVNILEKFASIPWHHTAIAAIKQMIADDHPGVQAMRTILKKANPKSRAALLNNLILGCLLLGYHRRLNFYNQYGVAPPGTLMISPTMRCNLNCYGCSEATHDNTEELSFDDVDRVLSDATAAGIGFIIVVGGEPFLVPWLLDMVEKHPQLAFLVFTNGLLLDDVKIKRLASLGNAAIGISVDGLQEETDARRGAGTFDTIMSTMNKLSQAGVFVGFAAMMSRRNFDIIYSDAFIDTMIQNGAGYGWITIALPQGSACQEPDLLPTTEQKARVGGLVRELRQRKPILLIDFLNDAELTEGCGAARIVIHVNAKGDVEPCLFMPFTVDNIKKKSLADIMRSEFFQGLRDINKRYCHETQSCMWTYKPHDVLQVVHACGAKVTSEGVMEKLHELANGKAEK